MTRLPPCGGSGLKYIWTVSALEQSQSPSMRREWIEIRKYHSAHMRWPCLPPCGGSGLKWTKIMRDEDEIMSPSMRREWIEMLCLRPSKMGTVSPSMRREWIEMLVTATSSIVRSASPSMRREWIEISNRMIT